MNPQLRRLYPGGSALGGGDQQWLDTSWEKLRHSFLHAWEGTHLRAGLRPPSNSPARGLSMQYAQSGPSTLLPCTDAGAWTPLFLLFTIALSFGPRWDQLMSVPT